MYNKKRQTIMLVDDNQANLSLGKNMLKDFYEVYALPSAERLFKFLESVTPDLILLDVSMPHINGFDVLRMLKADARCRDIPVIFVTARTEETDELEGLALGAVDYVAKPFSAAILLKRIENQLLIKKQQAELNNLNDNLLKMVKEKTAQVMGLQNSIITSLSEIVEFRDAYTGGHIIRTQRYMALMIEYIIEHDIYSEDLMGWNDTERLILASQLHDVGKIFIPDSILNKPGRLTVEEFEIMKTHAVRGEEAIRKMRGKGQDDFFLESAEIIAATHHEKWDGSGYPRGLKGENIPLAGRLMAVADVYDALTTSRPYKEPMDREEAARIIARSAGVHFDPVLTEVFSALEKDFAAIVNS